MDIIESMWDEECKNGFGVACICNKCGDSSRSFCMCQKEI